MTETLLIQVSKQELAVMIEAAVSKALVITKKEDELPPVLTLTQAARYYGKTINTIKAWVVTGKLKAIKNSYPFRFERDQILKTS